MSTLKRIQGNSLWVNVVLDTYADFVYESGGTVTWSDFTGSYKVTNRTGTILIPETAMTRSDTVGTFYLRISTDDMALLTASTYTITIQVRNLVIDYEEERQDTLVITAPELIV